MAEVLVEFADPVADESGRQYTARACGSEMDDGRWQGWIEFLPVGSGEPIRTSRETTQPNHADAAYWATGLTYVYLEGALRRALNPLVRPAVREIQPPFFDDPAPAADAASPSTESVLNPFSVYRKGEPLLRQQLSALSGWHLVNIIRHYGLSRLTPEELGALPAGQLVELISSAVRQQEAVSRSERLS